MDPDLSMFCCRQRHRSLTLHTGVTDRSASPCLHSAPGHCLKSPCRRPYAPPFSWALHVLGIKPCALLPGDQPDHALIRQAAALVRRLPVMDVQQFDSSFLTVSA